MRSTFRRAVTAPAILGLGTVDDLVGREPVAGVRESVTKVARFSLGLLGLFVVYVTMWLGVWAVASAAILGWTSVVLTSGSMSPSINTGDVVVTSPSDGQELAPGTVVVFPDRAGLVTHRIVGVSPDGSYVTRGDAAPQSDPAPLRPEDVVGVGRLLVPLIGLPLVWYWTGAWGKLALWAVGTVLALWLARYALLERYDPWAQPEEIAHAQA